MKKRISVYYSLLAKVKIELIPTDELASEAWLTKCRYGNLLSIVDCFVYALGKKEDALILTTDSAFKELDVKVEWFEVL